MVATWSMFTPRRRRVMGSVRDRCRLVLSVFSGDGAIARGALSPRPLHRLHRRASAEGRGDVGQVAGVLHLQLEIGVEEGRMAVVHVEADDIAARLADDGA